MPELLKTEDLAERLAEVPEWLPKPQGEPARSIERTYEFKNFVGSMRFVVIVAEKAEEMNHHPDIDIRWNKVRLELSTHSAGGLTDLDFQLAKECDGAAQDERVNPAQEEEE